MNIDPYLSACRKLNCKQIKGLDRKPDTLNLLEQKVGNSFEFIDTGENLPNRVSLAQTLRSTINKWDLMKLKIFYKVKISIIWTKLHCIEWKKGFLPTPDLIED